MRCVTNLGCALFRVIGHRPPFSLPGNLVSQPLAGDDGYVLADAFVGVEIVRESSVVLLDDDPRRLFYCLGSNPPLRENETYMNTLKQRFDSSTA